MTGEIIPYIGPRELAAVSVKPPALFLPDEKPPSASSASSPPISPIKTRDTPITRPRAVLPIGARAGERQA